MNYLRSNKVKIVESPGTVSSAREISNDDLKGIAVIAGESAASTLWTGNYRTEH